MNHSSNQDTDFTMLLQQVQEGDQSASEKLFTRLQDVMRGTANRLMQKESADHTLQPTAVVNEAVLRILSSDLLMTANNRRYLFASANKAMKDILVDHARSRDAQKRTGGRKKSSLDSMLDALWQRDKVDICELNDALETLRQQFPRQAEVTELRFFSGLDNEEIAELLDISIPTVKRDWVAAKSRLKILMRHSDDASTDQQTSE